MTVAADWDGFVRPETDYDERTGTASVLCDCDAVPVLHAHAAPWAGGPYGHYDPSIFHAQVRIATEAEILAWREAS